MATSQEDSIAALYTLQIGRLFCSIGLLEQTTVNLLLMIGSEAQLDSFQYLHGKLRKSTFGQLVARLDRHGISGRYLNYLRKINKLRNEVIHGLFWSYPFPGDEHICQEWLQSMIDDLEKMQLHFRIAERKLTHILIRSGCVDFIDLGEVGKILGPKGSWLLNEDTEEIG